MTEVDEQYQTAVAAAGEPEDDSLPRKYMDLDFDALFDGTIPGQLRITASPSDSPEITFEMRFPDHPGIVGVKPLVALEMASALQAAYMFFLANARDDELAAAGLKPGDPGWPVPA